MKVYIFSCSKTVPKAMETSRLLYTLNEILENCSKTSVRITIGLIKNALDRNIPSLCNVEKILMVLNEILVILKKDFVIECKYESLNILMVKAINMCSIRESLVEFFIPLLCEHESIVLYKTIMNKINGMIGTGISYCTLKKFDNVNYHFDNLRHADVLRKRGYPISYYDGTPLMEKIKVEEDRILKTDEKLCPICLDEFVNINNIAILDKCKHKHCVACIEELFTRQNVER